MMTSHSQSEEGEEDSSSIMEENLDDVTLRCMKNSGFMSKIKGEIARYVLDMAKSTKMSESLVFPKRANEQLLIEVFWYLKWVGMKGTAAVLLSESPISPMDIGASTEEKNVERFPKLFKLFFSEEDQEGDEKATIKNKKDLKNVTSDSSQQTEEILKIKEDQPPAIPNLNLIQDWLDPSLISAENKNENLALRNFLGTARSGSNIDLLTGSPLSTPKSSLSRASLGHHVLDNEVGTPKKSFDDLLNAYVNEDKSFTKSFPEKQPNSKEIEKEILTSTPIINIVSDSTPKNASDKTFVLDSAEKDKTFTPNTTAPDKTFTITGEVTLVQEAKDDEDEEPSKLDVEVDSQSSASSLTNPDTPKSGLNQKDSEDVIDESSRLTLETPKSIQNQKMESIDGQEAIKKDEHVEKKEKETALDKSDVSSPTSEIISELEEDNDNTQDISLASDAKEGMSSCEHVVSAD